jgi:hypothetical protein
LVSFSGFANHVRQAKLLRRSQKKIIVLKVYHNARRAYLRAFSTRQATELAIASNNNNNNKSWYGVSNTGRLVEFTLGHVSYCYKASNSAMSFFLLVQRGALAGCLLLLMMRRHLS